MNSTEAGGITRSIRSSTSASPRLVSGWGSEVDFEFSDYETGDRSYGTRLQFIQASAKGSLEDRSAYILSETYGTDSTYVDGISFEVENNFSDGVLEVLQGLQLGEDESIHDGSFVKYIKNIVLDASNGTAPVEDMDPFLRNVASTMPDLIMRNMAYYSATEAVLIGNDRDTKSSQAYRFGYDSDQQPRLVVMAGPEKDPDFAAANPDLTDDEVYERFGGNEKNPPYYIKDPDREGWLRLMDMLIPNWDGCDPVDGSKAAEPLINFDDLADQQDELSNQYIDDERLYARPSSQCAWAKPYSEIFSKTTAAGVDTSIYATIRIYVVEALMKGLPVFKTFGAGTYDLALASYLARKMEEDLQSQGVWGLPSKKYYYKFMEQVVQMFGRQMDAGMIDPTPLEREAVNNLNNRQIEWSKTQPNGIRKKAYMNSLYDEVEAALEEELEEGTHRALEFS